ncbi:MAG TPA: GAF domain-containing sensor histidine kinase [Polyangiaceae bacterium]|nr:GAF domain-containing sensor histidine kinase [Polyangiaceae bacterium]
MTPLEPSDDYLDAVRAVSRIDAVPTILEVLCRTTGMGFAAVVRVTDERWVACSVRDEIEFGLVPGGELKVATTLCREVRHRRETIAINHVAEDAVYCGHPTPAMYGFQSYISTPIILKDGSFFGTLCAIDPRPANVKTPETLGMFKLFAELIGIHLDTIRQLDTSEASLLDERKSAELREQFIAVLGHDLRNPLGAILGYTDLLEELPSNDITSRALAGIKRSGRRMSSLINDVLDFARGRLGGGLQLTLDSSESLEEVLQQVIAELGVSFPDRGIETDLDLNEPVKCDRARLGQLFSNLLGNALTHGAPEEPVRVRASTAGGAFQLTVSNKGEPIPLAALEQLFQPFFRGAVRPNQQGLGLGLYIASEIAKAHAGTLEAVSTPAETTFTFRMPLG